jgi:hypothetical protein
MGFESRAGVLVVLLLVCVSSASAERRQCRRSTLPSNVELLADLDEVLQRIYHRSATFRSQCERIARASNLRVRVHINTRIPRLCRALTIVQRQGYEIVADVHLPPASNHAELVGHEFEHLLEQIEGLDLRRLARVRGAGVREVERGMFETDRAQDAGKIVAMEVYASRARATD